MALKYGCTMLNGTNKTGVVKPDENGYYLLILGALNIKNSTGIWYDYETSKHVLDNSSRFMRRMSAGNLYAERGHPQKTRLMTNAEHVQRVLKIDQTNQCAHIKEVIPVPGPKNPDGSTIMLLIGKVKPWGEKGKDLKEALETPGQNVNFSLRCLFDPMTYGGGPGRSISELVTFDWVVEPGLWVASKFYSPACEEFEEAPLAHDIYTSEVTDEQVNELIDLAKSGKVAMESDELSVLEAHCHPTVKQSNCKIAKPTYMGW